MIYVVAHKPRRQAAAGIMPVTMFLSDIATQIFVMPMALAGDASLRYDFLGNAVPWKVGYHHHD
jgi:hypothetical protein